MGVSRMRAGLAAGYAADVVVDTPSRPVLQESDHLCDFFVDLYASVPTSRVSWVG